MDSLDFPKKSLAAIYGSLGSVTTFMEKCYHWRKKSAPYPWKFQNMGHKTCNESDSTSWFQAIGVQSIHLHDLWDRYPGTNASYIYRQGRRTAQFSHCPSTGQTKAMSWQSTPLIQSLDAIILCYLLDIRTNGRVIHVPIETGMSSLPNTTPMDAYIWTTKSGKRSLEICQLCKLNNLCRILKRIIVPLSIGSMGRLYIYLHEWLIFMIDVGKYTSPMDHVGCGRSLWLYLLIFSSFSYIYVARFRLSVV